ncbi:prepilin-type N-terminal cleavage/methylation domain-containing protein [Candidatus Peregrinibacteria bacterium]|nr:prepilin-type N-terminal cleavage/methylation domain-containing protein [Candidatus Peregrinibacteria bacterium]
MSSTAIGDLKLKGGFTLAEILIATVVLALLITFASAIYTNFFSSIQNLKATNTVYQESRLTLERIIQDIQNKTIDYEEYFDKNSTIFGTAKTYGDNYCTYTRQFFSAGLDDLYGTKDDKNTGKIASASAMTSSVQNELYLIDSAGAHRTYYKKIKRMDGTGNSIEQIGVLKLVGKDYGLNHLPADKDEGEGDGLVDTWVCDDGFTCETEGGVEVSTDNSFRPITPTGLNIRDIRFIIAPLDDPRRGFNIKEIQIQPYVTVKLIAEASKRIARSLKGNGTPSITLESSVSSRVYNEVAASCPLKECENGKTKACPKNQGVCKNAVQVCTQNVWPGCTDDAYKTYVKGIFNKDLYESNETTCDDRKDNDCNGLADEFDSACIVKLCGNGIRNIGLAPIDFESKDDLSTAITPGLYDPRSQDEKCKDVGGLCQNLNPYQPDGETLCADGYDNDCNFQIGPDSKPIAGTGADEFDKKCVDILCSNGIQNKDLASTAPLQARDYLINKTPGAEEYNQDEIVTDVGGLCAYATVPHPVETPETSCSDGLDNDGNTFIDLADPACVTQACHNTKLDTGETCIDAGGICGALAPENTSALCADGIDNDCNGIADWQEQSCCTDDANDQDHDGYKIPGGICAPPAEKIDCLDTDPSVHPPIDPLHPTNKEIEQGLLCYDGKNNFCSTNKDDQGNLMFDSLNPTCCTDFDGDSFGDRIGSGPGVWEYNLASCEGTKLLQISLLAEGRPVEEIDPKNHPELYADCNDHSTDINPGKMEICDGNNVDFNCNTKKGYEDDFCVTQDGLSFFDTFSATAWKSAENNASWDGSGKITIDPPETPGEFSAISKILPIKNALDCPGVTYATLHADALIPPGTSIRYLLTNNESAWQDISEDEEFHFTESKRKLRWQAVLEGDGISQAPELKSITLNYRCD